MSDHTSEAARKMAFLLDLRELTKKHGIAIGGCGCCGSPWLDAEAPVTDERAGYAMPDGSLMWVEPGDSYGWEKYSGSIVRPKG